MYLKSFRNDRHFCIFQQGFICYSINKNTAFYKIKYVYIYSHANLYNVNKYANTIIENSKNLVNSRNRAFC